MVNYVVDPGLLYPYLPKNTELDFYEDKCFLSLVGFRFLNTKVYGIKIPYHINFEEVNLRFYVRYKGKDGARKRGVVFIKESVPKKAITWLANKLYRENYETMLMKHEWSSGNSGLRVAYFWGRFRWNSIWLHAHSESEEIKSGSLEEFIANHYWGFTKVDDQKTLEYEIVHPRWKVYPVKKCYVDVSFDRIYGQQFSFLRQIPFHNALLAEGSNIKVKKGKWVN